MDRDPNGEGQPDETGYSATAKVLLALSLGLLPAAVIVVRVWSLFD